MNARKHLITTPRIIRQLDGFVRWRTRMSRMLSRCTHGFMSCAFGTASASTGRGGYSIRRERGFSLVIALVMVALMAVIAVGVFTVVSLDRVTATSYSNRYQAELAVQNGLQAAAKTFAIAPFPSPAPTPLPSSITALDTFLVVRADGPVDANGNRAAYYYLAQPAPSPSSNITYYPLFSASTNPSDPSVIQTRTINLAAPAAPAVPTPAPPANSNPTDPGAAWNAAGTQRVPSLYSWEQPSPSPSGVSVKWVEMRDPQDAPSPAPHSLPYTRYAYWVEDLDGYLDASQVGGQTRTTGTDPHEIAMFTIFDPAEQTDPGNTVATTLINNRPLLFTVPTVQQIASTNPDVAGPNLAVRLGEDNNPGEQNLVPLGYGYGRNDASQLGEGYPKTPINPVSQLGLNGNQVGKLGNLGAVMPGFGNRAGTAGRNYLSNVSANLFNYAFPLDAPTEFMPGGDPTKPNAYRGIGAYPFVVSVYDLNNWVQTIQVGTSWQVVIETKTYVQIWNAHNYPPPNPLDPSAGLSGALTVHYQDSDKVNVNGTNQTLSSPPDATIIFTANPDPNNKIPAIVSPLFETGNVGQPFNYQIKAGSGYQDPKGRIKPNEYRVVALPGPTPACLVQGRINYNASGLPPGLSLHGGGSKAGLINGTPTSDPPYTNGYHDYSVTITARTNCGNASATLTIRIFQ